jgi:hypothetical protein
MFCRNIDVREVSESYTKRHAEGPKRMKAFVGAASMLRLKISPHSRFI